MTAETKKPGFFSRRVTKGATFGAALLFFIMGIIFWGGFNTAMEATNTMEFCISCHEMEENVYQEYKPSIHHSNRSGVRATCSDCHVPKPWIHKMVRKVKASNEVWHKILGTINTPEKFDNKRLTLAKNVWKEMKKTDSRECRNCHNLESMNPAFQKPRARKQHLNAMKEGQTCIDCHKGIAHKGVRDLLSDEELEELEKPNPEFVREVPQMFLDGLKVVEQQEKEAEEKVAKEKAIAKKKKKAAKEAEKQRIKDAVDAAVKTAEKRHVDDAVKAALAKAGTTAPAAIAASSPPATDTAVATSSAVDWGSAHERDITIFYPGKSSMEWALTGKDHGGARPFTKLGDTCVTCHDKETDKMGTKIVSGEKKDLEPAETLIPGKRGSIPVNVKAVHDDKYLYMRFEWENGEHNPVPFVEGGKMDPDNPMKLAIMFATDDVKYASQSGCWQSCHHDNNKMPHNPGQEVTKYLGESRTKIEVKGRRGKKRGGWDKRKPDADIAAELEAGRFMDIIRYKSGKGEIEDGHLLADRIMKGGQDSEFIAKLEGDTWVVEMKRLLNSGKSGDIKMDLDKLYNFGFAIHDDHTDSRFHHVSLGYRLGFDNDKADVNAGKQDVKAPVANSSAAPAKIEETTTSTAAPKVEESQAVATAPAATSSGTKVDWSNSPEREITIFYPGQSSMEWMLTGKDHGGARPFVKLGDRCTTCHDKETAKMGEKIVTGEKLEPEKTLIPDKRGSIAVNVQASHDDENLYMRFEWENSEHTPAPFVDGGKMDPENPMKLAIMFATDEVKYAGQSGCWATCHHDANGMPHAPADTNVTKYLTESRTKIEIKGRRGKMRGGWDKRKTDDEIKAEMDASHFMDIIRYKSGKQVSEDGHILADRIMEGGQPTEFEATLDGSTWVVVMKRKLNSDKLGDIKMEMDKIYNFGFAIHDDHTDARFHHVSLGYKLGFDNDKAEVNATKL